jgi:hypothetical protein
MPISSSPISWSEIDANLSDAVQFYASSKISFTQTGSYDIYTVKAGDLFLIDQMEVITTNCSFPVSAPYVSFGNELSLSYYSGFQTISNSTNSRDVVWYPQNAAPAGTRLTVSIITGSTATGYHSGVMGFRGSLLKI